jgi:hypothetical protein
MLALHLRSCRTAKYSVISRNCRIGLDIVFVLLTVGDLRFRPPVEPQSWSGVRNAVEQPNSCYQQVNQISILVTVHIRHKSSDKGYIFVLKFFFCNWGILQTFIRETLKLRIAGFVHEIVIKIIQAFVSNTENEALVNREHTNHVFFV